MTPSSQNPKSKIWTKNFILMTLCSMLSWISINMMFTTIAPYSVHLNASTTVAGFIAGSFFIFSLIARPFSGYLGNKYNRKRLLFVVSGAWSLLILLMVFIPNLYVIAVSVCLQGIMYSILSALQLTIAADLLPPDRIGEGIGYFGLCVVIGQITAAPVALFLIGLAGYSFMHLVCFLLRVISVLLILTLPSYKAPSRAADSAKKRISIHDIIAKESLIYSLTGLLFSTLNAGVIAFMVLYAQENNIRAAGLFFVFNATVSFISRVVTARWADSRTLASTALLSGLILIVSMLLLGLGKNEVCMMIAGACFGLGYGTLLPVMQSKSVKAPPLERRNLGSNTYLLGIDTGFALGNFTGGNIAERVGFANMYLWLIIPACMAMALALWKGRNAK